MKQIRFFTVDGKNASTDVSDESTLKELSESLRDGCGVITLGDPENPDVIVNFANGTAIDMISIKEETKK